MLRPGEQYRYHFIPQPHMRDIAVMVEFRDIDNSRWRVVSPVDQPKTPEVFVSIARNTVEFTTPKPLEQPRNE
ncbi:Type VI secretion lipoprotein [compost metagenome]